MSDSSQIGEVEAGTIKILGQGSSVVAKISKLQGKIDKAKEVYQKASVVEEILKNGGEKKFDFKKLGLLGVRSWAQAISLP